MPYSTAAQIASECKFANGFNDGPGATKTNPTAAKVAEIIAEVDARIDGQLSTKYIVPVTDARDILIIEAISIALACERVREIAGVTNQAQGPEQKFTQSSADKARKDLCAILEGTIKLNATLIDSQDGTKSYAQSNGLTATFVRGTKQW